jgi:acetyl-CoA carboxylase / biotin carboxylase 1
MVHILRSSELPYLEFHEIAASISSRLPPPLFSELQIHVEEFRESGFLDLTLVENTIDGIISSLSPDDQVAVTAVMEPVCGWINKYRKGIEGNFQETFLRLMNTYYEICAHFDGCSNADALSMIRDKFASNLDQVLQISLASSKLENSGKLILEILEVTKSECALRSNSSFYTIFEKLAGLSSPKSSAVSLRAREIVITSQQPTFKERQASMLAILKSATKSSTALNSLHFDQSQLAQLVTSDHAILNLLTGLFFDNEMYICAAALYTYVAHTYQAYSIIKMYYLLTKESRNH